MKLGTVIRHGFNEQGYERRERVDAIASSSGPAAGVLIVVLPLRTQSETNAHEHWRVRQKRAKQHRTAVLLRLRTERLPVLPVDVTVTRLAPRKLDAHDNLPSSAKFVIDGVADAYGIWDDDPRIRFRVEQEKAKLYGVRIRIDPRPADGHTLSYAPDGTVRTADGW